MILQQCPRDQHGRRQQMWERRLSVLLQEKLFHPVDADLYGVVGDVDDAV